jgi:hypothetical protein
MQFVFLMVYCPLEEQIVSALHASIKSVQLQADFKSNDIPGLSWLSGPPCILGNPALKLHRANEVTHSVLENGIKTQVPGFLLYGRLAGGTIPFIRRYSTICP